MRFRIIADCGPNLVIARDVEIAGAEQLSHGEITDLCLEQLPFMRLPRLRSWWWVSGGDWVPRWYPESTHPIPPREREEAA